MTNDEVDRLLAPVRVALLGGSNPSTSPVVTSIGAANFRYVRKFRLPPRASNGATFAFGGTPLAMGYLNTTLFVGTRTGEIAEVTIPAPDEEFAVYAQGFSEPSEGQIAAKLPGAGLTGLMLTDDGHLMGNALVYYDANNSQRVSHFLRPRDLADRGNVSPLASVGPADRCGYVAGYMVSIPPAWRAKLGGSALTGGFGSPIVTRESLGPSVVSFNPAPGPMSCTPLVYYPSQHATLGGYAVGPANPVFNMTAKADGAAIVGDWLLLFGRSGVGEQLYGAGTGNPALAGTIESGSDRWVFDPADSSKGTHAWPYRYQVWAYRLSDLADVASGAKQPWEVVPTVWEMVLPTVEPNTTGIGGVAYNSGTRRLFVSQLRADQDGYEYRALIHELEFVA